MRGTMEIGDPNGSNVTVGELIEGLDSISDAQDQIGPAARGRLIEVCVYVNGQVHTVPARAVRIPLEEA